jgi:hypothetical protein
VVIETVPGTRSSLIKGIFLILIMRLRERQSDTVEEERNKVVVGVVTAETVSSF